MQLKWTTQVLRATALPIQSAESPRNHVNLVVETPLTLISYTSGKVDLTRGPRRRREKGIALRDCDATDGEEISCIRVIQKNAADAMRPSTPARLPGLAPMPLLRPRGLSLSCRFHVN